ncbi:MAG: undecaprenyl-diphosphate phosphatase [Verrucomicrobia bacterium]|nr:undecaprenyl-diphosphate phosphatase [Verrucomicrobiota bacterium]
MRRLLTLILASCTLLSPLRAAAPASQPVAELRTRDAIILGLIEGITEYLPISSTGHLIIASRFLGLESERPLTDQAGHPLWYRKPSARHPEGIPLTTKLAADTYSIVIQFGAIAAVALLYWRQILSAINGVLGRDPAGFILARNLILAFVPAAVIGLAVHDWIDAHLFSVGTVLAAQVVGAGLILWAERYRRQRSGHGPVVETLTASQSVGVGLLQCVAMWPGTSRSMMTIVGGYLAGLEARKAAEFSFLLGFVTLTAATGYKSLQSGGAMIQVFGWPHVILGCVVATVAAALAVRFLVTWLTRHGMGVFAYYRLALAAVLAAVTWL